ncbi:hypothetical protein FHQ22_01905 [Pasteurellaceae bacterium Phil31]|nr:hypothetical protein FHQ22_01905 [Pasteurellaceae bacterium Phil31]
MQDSEQQHSSASGVGGRVQVSFGTAWEASANVSAQKGSANRTQVNQQSGLFAEEHYDVEAKNVHLNGGAIAGTQTDKNRLATNQLTFTDIENHSESKAVSASIGVSTSSDLNKDENGKVIKNDKGEPERVTDVSPTGGLPMVSKTRDNTTTQATLSEGTIILNKDSSPIQTTAAALGINSDSSKGNAQTEKPKDINTTLATQKAMQSAVADISAGVSAYSAQQRKVAEVKKADAAQAMANAQQSGNQAAYEQAVAAYEQADSEAKAWGTGGSYNRAVDTATKVITLAIANGNTAQLTAIALSPLANQAIKDATTDENGKVDKTTNLILHGILGAVEAQVNGGSALGGAAAAITGEVTAELLAKTIYGKSASELDERERQNISSLSSLTGALSATIIAQTDGTATDSTTALVNAATGQVIAESAVEGNLLSIIESNPQVDWANVAKSKAFEEEANRIAIEQMEKNHPELMETLRAGGTISGILADFTPVVGDVKSFVEAEDGIDFALALVGVIPGAEVVTKTLKEAKQLYIIARKAEKAGDLKQAQKNIDQAKILLQDNDVVGFYQSHTWRESFENQYGKNNVKSTTVVNNSRATVTDRILKTGEQISVVESEGNKAVKIYSKPDTLGNKKEIANIPYDSKGLPIFDDVAVFSTRIDNSKSYSGQMRQASRDMWIVIKDDPIMKSKFTLQQLEDMQKGKSTITGYTWHHNVQSSPNNMQLVPVNIHDAVKHIGQGSLQKGK